MTASDDETVSARLAQVRAQRRHLDRLRVAERRDALDEGAAQRASEREVQQQDDAQPESMTSEDSRSVLLAEEAALALEQSSLVADRDLGDDFGMDL